MNDIKIGSRRMVAKFAAQEFTSVYQYAALEQLVVKKKEDGVYWKKISSCYGKRGFGILNLSTKRAECARFFGLPEQTAWYEIVP
jgi:hypothetical protein